MFDRLSAAANNQKKSVMSKQSQGKNNDDSTNMSALVPVKQNFEEDQIPLAIEAAPDAEPSKPI